MKFLYGEFIICDGIKYLFTHEYDGKTNDSNGFVYEYSKCFDIISDYANLNKKILIKPQGLIEDNHLYLADDIKPQEYSIVAKLQKKFNKAIELEKTKPPRIFNSSTQLEKSHPLRISPTTYIELQLPSLKERQLELSPIASTVLKYASLSKGKDTTSKLVTGIDNSKYLLITDTNIANWTNSVYRYEDCIQALKNSSSICSIGYYNPSNNNIKTGGKKIFLSNINLQKYFTPLQKY